MLNNAPDLVGALHKYIEENADLKHQAEEYFNERVASLAKGLLEKAATSPSGATIVTFKGPALPDMAKSVAFKVREFSPKATVFIGATFDAAHKPLLTLMVTEDLTQQGLNASQLVREAAKNIKGGGGGQPGFAQAGGKDAEGLEAAFQTMFDAIK